MKRLGLPMVVVAIVVAAVILRGSASTLPALLAVLVCPAMMFFMMRGMHHGSGDQGSEPRDEAGCQGDHEEHKARR